MKITTKIASFFSALLFAHAVFAATSFPPTSGGITAAQTVTLTNKTMSGANNTFTNISEGSLSTSDVTTNNATTSKHGFLKKLSGVAGEYMDGNGNWTAPSITASGDATLPAIPTTAGSANNFNLDFTPDLTLTDGATIRFRSNQNTTGAVTITPDGGTARALVYPSGRALSSGALSDNNYVIATYDATNTRWKLLSGSNHLDLSDGAGTYSVTISGSGLTGNRSVTMGNLSGSILTTATAANVSSKTMDVSNTYTARRDRFTMQDDADATKQMVFSLSGITTGNTRTMTIPNASVTLVGEAFAQTLTNKTISGANNTLSNIAESSLALTDVTTANASTSAHGFLKKLPNDAGKYMDGVGNWASLPPLIQVAISDETTALTTGTAKITFRAPCAFTMTAARASLTTVSTSGLPTFDINEAGTTVLSTKLTIDANEKTSVTAATPPVISDSAIADDAEMTVDIDTAGTGAAGAKINIYGYCS